jgi:hypothetical protein
VRTSPRRAPYYGEGCTRNIRCGAGLPSLPLHSAIAVWALAWMNPSQANPSRGGAPRAPCPTSEHTNGAAIRLLDPLVRASQSIPPSARDGSIRSRGIFGHARHRAPRLRLHAQSGALGAALSVPRCPEAGIALARPAAAVQARHAAADRDDGRGSRRRTRPSGRPARLARAPALRHGHANHGSAPPTGEGPRLCPPHLDRALGQGEQRPRAHACRRRWLPTCAPS